MSDPKTPAPVATQPAAGECVPTPHAQMVKRAKELWRLSRRAMKDGEEEQAEKWEACAMVAEECAALVVAEPTAEVTALRAQLATVTAERDAARASALGEAEAAIIAERLDVVRDGTDLTYQCAINDALEAVREINRAPAAQPNTGEPATPVTIRRPVREVAMEIINETMDAAKQLQDEGGIDNLDDADFRAVVVEHVERIVEADRRGEP